MKLLARDHDFGLENQNFNDLYSQTTAFNQTKMTAQAYRRRTALAEIPVRMSQLRISTDEVPVLLNRTVIDSPLDNIQFPIGYLTPSPSQDECK